MKTTTRNIKVGNFNTVRVNSLKRHSGEPWAGLVKNREEGSTAMLGTAQAQRWGQALRPERPQAWVPARRTAPCGDPSSLTAASTRVTHSHITGAQGGPSQAALVPSTPCPAPHTP